MDYFRNVSSFACRMFWKENSRNFCGCKNAESTDEKNTLDFVDAHGERYTVEINEAVAKNPYNKALFVKNENKISYEDKKYTSRLGVDVSVFREILTGSR